MDNITIYIVDLQSPATPVEGGPDPLRTMIRVPYFRCNENVLPLDVPLFEHFLHRLANRLFVVVAFRTIQVSKSHF